MVKTNIYFHTSGNGVILWPWNWYDGAKLNKALLEVTMQLCWQLNPINFFIVLQ